MLCRSEQYRAPGTAEIERDFAARERRGRERYLADPGMAERWREHGIESLAQFYTSPIKYDPDVLGEFGQDLAALLRRHGFLD
mgnify:FL=1